MGLVASNSLILFIQQKYCEQAIMDKQQKEEIRKKIENEITVTKQDVSSLKELTKPIAPDNAVGRLSRMDAINNRSINQANLTSARQKLNMLNKALTRIDSDPDFGICVECGSPIPLGRIMIMPEANLCVPCAS
jgi:DnaK suppressor protein